jgi:hypothetical protein
MKKKIALKRMKKKSHPRNPIHLKIKMKIINQARMKVSLVRLLALYAKKR